MKAINKRILSMIIIALMVFGLLTGCNQPKSDTSKADTVKVQTSATTQKEATPKEATPTPAAKKTEIEPVTLTAFIDAPSTVLDWQWGDDAISKEITKRTGVTIKAKNATTTDHQELSTMLASGINMTDFIIVQPFGPMSHMLISQGFAAPLNKFADKHDPNFWKVLPTDEDKIFNWDDGNLYFVCDQFGDEKRMGELKEPFSPMFSFMVNVEMLKKVGNPKIATLEDLKEVLKLVKKDSDTDFTLFDGNIKNPQMDANLAQAINRMMGGTNVYSIQAGDTVRLNFQDKAYYEALKYINSLYRDGTFNAENFTVTSEQLKQILAKREMFAYFGHNWQILSGYEGGFAANAPYQHAEYPISSKVSPKDVKLFNNYANVYNSTAVFINAKTKYPDRTIKYLSFLLSDEGQILAREGVEGVTYTLDKEGTPTPTDLRKKYEAGPIDKLTKDLGMNNPKFAWLNSNWVLAKARHLRIINEPYYGAQLSTAKPYASWERLNILSGIVSDTKLLEIRTQVFELWKNKLPQLYLAKSDSEFEAAYQKFIFEAKALGLDKLEASYTENYKKYKSRGIK